jgi:hypothetical protein
VKWNGAAKTEAKVVSIRTGQSLKAGPQEGGSSPETRHEVRPKTAGHVRTSLTIDTTVCQGGSDSGARRKTHINQHSRDSAIGGRHGETTPVIV